LRNRYLDFSRAKSISIIDAAKNKAAKRLIA